MAHIWEYHASDQSAAAVATVFAARYFGEPREVESCYGTWYRNGEWSGSFTLRDGVKTYGLTGFRGRWLVSNPEAP